MVHNKRQISMPAIVEIAYDNTETVIDYVLPSAEYWLDYTDPSSLEKCIMRISCAADDGYTKVEVSEASESVDDLTSIDPTVGLTDKTEEIWEICDGANFGLVAVSHTALLVSDFQAVIN